jgi:hypothetical protein
MVLYIGIFHMLYSVVPYQLNIIKVSRQVIRPTVDGIKNRE